MDQKAPTGLRREALLDRLVDLALAAGPFDQLTDKYFTNTRLVVEAHGDAEVTYAVFLRPLDQLIINAGALILGVWGIRVVLFGTTLPGLTAVDLALWSVILFLLLTITVRTLWLLEEDSGWRLLRTLVRQRRNPEP